MSDYSAIADVGETLKKLLWEYLKEDNITRSILASEDQITFSSPDDIEPDKKLSLFLYQVTENVYLKNKEMQLVNSTKQKYPPLSLNLFYLVTPHTQNRESDQIILGKVMQIFHDNPILRGSVLQGSLVGSREELKVMLSPLSVEDLDKLWNVIFKSKPFKLSICYKVAPVQIDSLREREVTRITEREA